jgi:hypothetical protein
MYLTYIMANDHASGAMRHTVVVGQDEWELAKEIGELQMVPVSPSAVLKAAIVKGLSLQAEELSSAQSKKG